MQHQRTGLRGRPLTRRGILTAGLGLLVSACGPARRAASPMRAGSSHPQPAAPPTTVPKAPTTTVAEPGEAMTTVPVLAVPTRAKPAFYVDDVLPGAPATAIALTIDDGPDPRWTPQVLQELDAHGVKASFSVIGRYARQYPGLLREIVAQGHTLTNHSMNHPQPFASLPPAQVQTEVVGCLEAIYDATGMPPTTFRSPGGDWSPHVFSLLGSLGMIPIDWDVDPRDWSRPGTGYITSKMLAARPHDILLCHDGGGDRSETVAALRTVVPALLARGLTFVTL